MPTMFAAQNGQVIHQNTPIKVTNCTPTQAEKLAAALKACRKNKNHSQRARCEHTARHRYTTTTTAKKHKR
jgi:hypothetical protein